DMEEGKRLEKREISHAELCIKSCPTTRALLLAKAIRWHCLGEPALERAAACADLRDMCLRMRHTQDEGHVYMATGVQGDRRAQTHLARPNLQGAKVKATSKTVLWSPKTPSDIDFAEYTRDHSDRRVLMHPTDC
ncbi:MAG: hypothetical protein SGPRY_010619, partial [Prymnesium sp.]